jgi:phage-related protein
MPQTDVLIYQEADGTVPFHDWLAGLELEARDRCLARLLLLAGQGHELRRPHAENLGGGLYELRVKFYRINYRILYFFHERAAAVVSHGFSKEQKVPPAEIAMAAERRQKFKINPERHTHRPPEE